MRRRWAGVMAAVLCFLTAAVVAGPARAAPTVYLMAVNDTVIETTAGNMPIVVGGVLYVPYTMFYSRSHGINLGVSVQYTATRGTVLMSSSQRGVIFDTRNNTATDLHGNPLGTQAIVRNSLVYLPIAWVCGYFNHIFYREIQTRYGILVRLMNSAVILNDAEFVDAANSRLQDNFLRYQASLTPIPAEPSPAAAETPSPSQNVVQATGAQVRLAFRWGEQSAGVAEQLEAAGHRALFLFTVEELEQQDGLVRRLTAAGHTIGLALMGDSADDCLLQAKEGERLLAHITRSTVRIVSAAGLNEAGWQTLRNAGYVLWTANVEGDGAVSGPALLRQLRTDRINDVILTGDEVGSRLLSSVLRTLTGSGYSLSRISAPVLR